MLKKFIFNIYDIKDDSNPVLFLSAPFSAKSKSVVYDYVEEISFRMGELQYPRVFTVEELKLTQQPSLF